ncbi:M20/M25/M40 family metallo-hydrolase [Mucilaginibacter arboris]|uniref:Carboxypeptidase Q n=1 Tax=Mucilaginibacter arboris TaxID=2682090 RepID=A0A7K1SVA0_9SPHI|nr:M20/M25/M40 family metallo-hydrolase [Mucilaginibacter arboris]MVN21279.1 M20/M25/M40 family metallo-hydrolase [Mucilaginibacter arboris]
MRFKFLLAIFLSSSLAVSAQHTDSLFLRKIYDEALVNGKPYQNLEYLCKKIGPRLSGSANAQKAVDWTKKLMEHYGFDRVFLQEVMVPHWVRGEKEQAKIIAGNQQISVPVVALGGSVATAKNGLTAEVIEVQGLQELKTLGEQAVKGKIVFYNRPFDPRFIETGAAYSTASDQRFRGPAEAAKYGAVGVIVRSMTEIIDDYPHTGATSYEEGGNKIPAAAISTKGANQLSALLKQKGAVQFYFKQNCQTLPDVLSYNVVGELKGTENPNEFITVGGHLDSWDLAEGAHDDGTGVMQSVEVLRIFKAIGYRPKHSIRAVMFMNEENGHKGGTKYAELAQKNNEKHIAAIESDEGGFTPRGFSFNAIQPQLLQKINKNWKSLLEPYEVDRFINGGAGTDIEPLKATVPAVILIGFRPDSQRYFDLHHSAKDVFENVNKRELELGAASMASLIYLIDQHGLSF